MKKNWLDYLIKKYQKRIQKQNKIHQMMKLKD